MVNLPAPLIDAACHAFYFGEAVAEQGDGGKPAPPSGAAVDDDFFALRKLGKPCLQLAEGNVDCAFYVRDGALMRPSHIKEDETPASIQLCIHFLGSDGNGFFSEGD